jgi:hypothetical protein
MALPEVRGPREAAAEGEVSQIIEVDFWSVNKA